MNQDFLCLPATMRDGGMLADGTRRIYIYTQEVEPEQLFEILKHSGKLGWFFFNERPIKEVELKNLPDIKTESWEKHPSQRLRACLYRL